MSALLAHLRVRKPTVCFMGLGCHLILGDLFAFLKIQGNYSFLFMRILTKDALLSQKIWLIFSENATK